MTNLLSLAVTILLAWKHPPELLRDLSDDSIEIRERATAELYRLGEDIRGLLIEAHDAAGDVEVRSRLKAILRRLDADERIRNFGGANRVSGLAASLRVDRFFGPGPFRLSVDVMNVGSKDQDFPGIESWDVEFPDQELRSTRPEARLTVRRIGGSLGWRRTTWRSGACDAVTSTLLRPGECARFEVVIEARSLPPGDHQVSVEIFARDRIPGADENLRSNSVSLMVRK